MRRLRLEKIALGTIALAQSEAHHARDVLRLGVGDEVEVFDAQGNHGVAVIAQSNSAKVIVNVQRVEETRQGRFEWWVASAIPKGTRGDWMVEKLSELGAAGFVPLITQRSVVSAEGKNKRARWERLASESAKQSKRRGVMQIRDACQVERLVEDLNCVGWYLSLQESAREMREIVATMIPDPGIPRLMLLIGPEGGWTKEEMAMFDQAGLTGVRMGGSILRVETAAVAAGAIVAALVAPALE